MIALACQSGCLAAPAGSIDDTYLQLPLLEVEPLIDGDIGAEEWAAAGTMDGRFIQFTPAFGEASSFRTVVRYAQTESSLYFAFECFDPEMPRISAALTKRDADLERDDSVAVLLDSFLDRRSAYAFYVNPIATQLDGRITNNGQTIDTSWDAAWRSETKRYADRWTIEIEIPFSILKYSNKSPAEWGIKLSRSITRKRERTFWPTAGKSPFRVSDFGVIAGVIPPAQPDRWTFIPYALASVAEGNVDIEIGGDIRWRPSSRIGADLTFNPDFALVEANVEIINLTRFELQIPEKRPFFLEGNELYKQDIQQFYSRRIGDIDLGAKSSGRIDRTEFSLIATSEKLDDPLALGSFRADYGIIRLQHGLSRGSSFGIVAADRRFRGDHAGSVGLDSNIFVTEQLNVAAQFMRVHGPKAEGGLAWSVRPSWNTPTTQFDIAYVNLDEGILEDFNAVGFLQDDNRKELDSNFRHQFWFKSGKLEKFEPVLKYNRYWSQSGELRSWEAQAQWFLTFRSGWEFAGEYVEDFKLFEKEFRNDRVIFAVAWDGRDGRFLSAKAGSGRNFDSDFKVYGANLRWPLGDHFRLSYDFTWLDYEPNSTIPSSKIHVFEALYSFHANLYAKLLFQTNSAIDKENVQALWVWRFKPPFGSLQLAYQRGTSARGEVSEQGDSFFTKFSWVF